MFRSSHRRISASQRRIGFLALLLSLAAPAASQTPSDVGSLPAEVRDEAVDFLNSPAHLRIPGGTRVPEGVRIEGDVGVLGGSLELAGEVTGHLLVVNGDLHITSSGRIGGEILVLGGRFTTDPGGVVVGSTRVYALPLRYRTRAGEIEAIPEEAFAPGFLATNVGFGSARFTLRAGPAYNRIEGLPVRFGPLVRTAGSNPLALEAFGIWKSASGLNFGPDRLGYAFRVRQAVGGRGTIFVDVSAFHEIRAIEDRGMANVESSLSTFLLRRDLRDFVEVEGWTISLQLQPARSPLRLEFGYREEGHSTPLIRDPWTLRSSDRPWRPLALVADGRARSVEGELLWDTTDDPLRPSDGWRVAGSISRQVAGELRLPARLPDAPPSVPSTAPTTTPIPRFTHGMLDLRRYARVGPTSRLNLRVVARGSIDGSPLPPQLQSALGGEGTLPGHFRFAGDCGARRVTFISESGTGAEQTLFPGYGCDRTVLFQAEYQGSFPFSWNPVPADWEDSELSQLMDLQPVWSLFFNAGQGWAGRSLIEGVLRTDSPTRADVGIGVFLGPVGLYWSYPLNRRDRGLNFHVRLQPRF